MNAKNIYQRMVDIMKDVDYVQKEERRVNNQYRFVSHDAVVARVRQGLIDHGVVAIPTVTNHEVESIIAEIDGRTKTTFFTKLQIEMKFINAEDPKDSFVTVSHGYGLDHSDKGFGKAYSYAVKYAFLKTFNIETGDDPERDNIEPGKKPEQKDQPQPQSKEAPAPKKTKGNYANFEAHIAKCKTKADLEKAVKLAEAREWTPDECENIRALVLNRQSEIAAGGVA